jgi:glycosyltransferase involved in cell wall biosynthesis
VDQKQINSEFVSTFNKNPALINPLILKLFFKYLYNGIYFFSDITFVHTKTAKRVLGKYHRGWNKKIVIIPTAIPLVPQKTFKKKNYFFYFGYIARRKGLENLVSGFKSFLTKNPRTNFKLILAGGVIKGQESSLKELMGIMRSANLKNHIKYVGFLNRREQYKLYSESYAVVIPAKLSISASGPLYHALSHGKFILASNIGHLKDEIKHGVNGYLTDNDSWDQAFKTVTSRASLMRKIEEGAREEAGLRTPLRTAQKYYQYYQSLLS